MKEFGNELMKINKIFVVVAIIATVVCALLLCAEYVLNKIEKVEAEVFASEYGAYYVGDPRFGEVRVHDESGEYLFSVNGDKESASTYYWWMPNPNKGLTYENALNEIYINAVWENENIKSIVKYYGGKDIIVGCEPNRCHTYGIGGY